MKKVWDYLEENLEEILMVILLAAMSLVMIVQVVLRLASHGLTWAEEFCRYCFVYSGLLSAGYCTRKGLALRVEALYNFFPKAMQIVINYAAKIMQTIVYAYLAVNSFGLIATTTSISTAMQLPMQFVYMALPLGFGLGAIRGIQDLFRYSKEISGKQKEEVK